MDKQEKLRDKINMNLKEKLGEEFAMILGAISGDGSGGSGANGESGGADLEDMAIMENIREVDAEINAVGESI